ncbi:unnamed protein product [Owenia fusiformis]|uniref:VPS9 domain-containing protein n=1 Tax=Owenia fusiformis TaxID=6347 RepID=A0A8S4Q9A8_OWEFU|nr:unnamed protein product [Owenia fusiformis]
MNAAFIESHIFRPSPFFQGQYLTTDKASKGTIEYENGVIKTIEGFPKDVTAKVLYEETGYNKDYKPFSILLIDQLLVAPPKVSKSAADNAEDVLHLKTSFIECKTFLMSFKEHVNILANINDEIHQFNTNYMILPGYLDDVETRLASMCSRATKAICKANKHPKKHDKRFQDNISNSVESYIVGSVHHKVFPVIRDELKAKDAALANRISSLDGVTGDQLGIRDEFICPLPESVVELANLDNLTTPLEKLMALKTTIDRLTEGVNTAVEERQNPTDKEQLCLTSDDLLPILVSLIIQSKCPYLESNLYYIQHFHWSDSSKDEFGYILVTFQAALEFLNSTDFHNLRPAKQKLNKEVGIEKILEIASKDNEEQANQNAANIHPIQLSRSEKQLERITRMLEETTAEDLKYKDEYKPLGLGKPTRYSGVPDVIPLQDPSRKREQLGDFLSALQNDGFDTCSSDANSSPFG